MKAPEVHKVLRSEIGDWLQLLGFKTSKQTRLGYERTAGGRHQSIWVQLDKWGWDRYSGSKFFLNFRCAEGRGTAREERLGHFLTDAELEEARTFRNAVVARMPPPPAMYFEVLERQLSRLPDGPGILEAARAAFEPETIPYRRHQDFGLRYFTADDLLGWADLIRRVLPRALDEMGQWKLTA